MLNSGQNRRFLSRVNLKFDGWPCKIIGHLFDTTSSVECLFKAIGEFKLELQSGNAQFGSKSALFVPCEPEIGWPWKNNRAPLLCCCKFCASFHSHQWIQTWFTVRNCPLWVKIHNILAVWSWNWTLKNNKAPLLSNTKLCASSHHHMWIQTGVTVQKRLKRPLISVTSTFDLWPWPFVWTSLLSLVTSENFGMIRWWEHSEKAVTDRRTDRRMDWTIHRADCSELKNYIKNIAYNYI